MIEGISSNPSFLRDAMSQESQQPDFASNILRSQNPDILIVEPLCTHQSCTVAYQPPGQPSFDSYCQKYGCFSCPYHGSMFDLAGRVWNNHLAPWNLTIPQHEFIDETRIRIDFG